MELGGYGEDHPLIKTLAIAERSAYKHSNCIVSILPTAQEYVRGLGIDTKIVHVPNGVRLDQVEREVNTEIWKRVQALKEQGFFVVGYAGGLSVSNAMMDLIKASEILKHQMIAFVIIGNGTEKPVLVNYTQDNNLKNVHFFDPIPKKQIHCTLSTMDALYIGSQRSALYRYGLSANKIFDYMLTGNLLLMRWTATIVR